MIDDIEILHKELMRSLNEKNQIRRKNKGLSKTVILEDRHEDNSFIYMEYNIEEDIQRTVNISTKKINNDESY